MKTQLVGNVVVGKKDVDMALPSHVPGVHEGNWPKRLRRTSGVRTEETTEDRTAATRATGINPEHHGPVDPRMPKLTPP